MKPLTTVFLTFIFFICSIASAWADSEVTGPEAEKLGRVMKKDGRFEGNFPQTIPENQYPNLEWLYGSYNHSEVRCHYTDRFNPVNADRCLIRDPNPNLPTYKYLQPGEIITKATNEAWIRKAMIVRGVISKKFLPCVWKLTGIDINAYFSLEGECRGKNYQGEQSTYNIFYVTIDGQLYEANDSTEKNKKFNVVGVTGLKMSLSTHVGE